MSINELWPVFDTGLKVCLGAGITLGAAWLVEKKRHVNNGNDGARRRLLFEEISADVGRVNHCFAKYSSLVIESTRFAKGWPQARRQELEQVNAELVIQFNKLADAEAKLLMLGEKTMEKTLRLYGAKIALFRKQVYVGRQDITDQQIATLKTQVLTLREQFYDQLSKRYDRLLAA